MQPQPVNLYFDREHSLGELLREIDRSKLESILESLLGPQPRLLDADGCVHIGPAEPGAGTQRREFRFELEVLGYIEGRRAEALPAAALLMETLTLAVVRYCMASAIHMEAVQQDYRELEEKHSALQASEERFRALTAELERRVAAQVRTIEASQRQLYQAEKLASVGQLAAGVAHEINNPIGFVNSNLESAAGYLGRITRFGRLVEGAPTLAAVQAAWRREGFDSMLADFDSLLGESRDGIGRVARIVSQLREFASLDRGGLQAVELNTLIENVCTVAQHQLDPRSELVRDFGPPVEVRGHPGKLAQLFLNLLLNAVQALPGAGRVTLRTAAEREWVVVRVQDTGCGIPSEILERVFDPFFTTRGVGQGTGLGLTVARDVVRAHGGEIRIESEPGKGTVVTVWLPGAPSAHAD